jgi:methionine-rich copper-binding protein CopC
MKLNLMTVGIVLALGVATQASAHAHLVKSNPTANATVSPPKSITLTFNEKLTPAFSGFQLGMADGMTIKLKSALSKYGRSIVGVPQGTLMAGVYKVTWHAASADDGHRTGGALPFTVK